MNDEQLARALILDAERIGFVDVAAHLRDAASRLLAKGQGPVPYVLVVGVGAPPDMVVEKFPADCRPVACFADGAALALRGASLGTLCDGRVL